MKNYAHPVVVVDEEGIGVLVDDWEVYDFLDDLFTDADVMPTSMREHPREEGRLLEIRFSAPTKVEDVRRVLEKTSPAELAAIRAINSPPV